MLSHTSEYALRSVLYLAHEAPDGPVRVDDISEALEVPRNYLSKILHTLAKEGVLISVRGPHGGFRIGRPPDEVSLAEIVALFDPEPVAEQARCLLGRSACSEADPCPVHDRWMVLSREVREFFQDTTVADFSQHGTVLPPRG